MPVEVRRLTFSRSEIIQAALDYCGIGRIARPEADLEGIELDSDPRRAVLLRFDVASPVEPDEVVLTAADVIEALVLFCRFRGVPLPNETEKSLAVEGGEIVMYFHIDRRPRRSCLTAV